MRLPFRKRTEDRALWQVGDAYPGSSTHAGVTVTPDTALRSSAVWACVNLLADLVSTMPADVFRSDTRTAVEPKPVLITTPAAHSSFGDWTYQVMTSLLLRGNAFGLVVARTVAERPSQIEMLDSDRVNVTVDRNSSAVEYRLDGRVIDRDDLWHLRAYPVAGSPLGLSPVAYARQSIGLGLAAETFGAKFFGDNATPAGILTSDQVLTRDQALALHDMWAASRGGRRGTAVLGNGTKFQPISITPDESQFLDTQRFGVQQIARLYRIPPEMIGSESGASMTYANIETRDLSLLKYAVDPWLVRLENALTNLLPRGQFVKFNRASLLRTDTLSRYQSYKLGLEGGWLTLDEVRALEDRQPLPRSVQPPTGSPLGDVA